MPVFRTVTDAQQGEIRLEALHQPLYDAATLATTQTTPVSFFQNPSGRGPFLTNVSTAGQLSWPKRFSVKALRLVPAFSANATDLVDFYTKAVLKVVVGEKNYLTVPAFCITPGVGLEVALITGNAAPAAPANGLNYGHNGRPDHRNIYTLIHSIYIPPVQNFNVALEFNAALAMGATVVTHVFLEGELLREIQ